jgi:2-octaprenyl-6-methoxyphenol hydroxylase
MGAQQADVVVAGGGLAGATAALALAAEGLDVVLVDAASPAATGAAPDGRASAISYAPFRLWRSLGIADRLEAMQPIAGIVVTEGAAASPAPALPSPAWIGFDADELQDGDAGEPLGWMVENAHAQAAVAATLAASSVQVVAPAAVESVNPGAAASVVHLRDGEAIRAPLVVAADGRDSALRTQAGIDALGWNYGQTAVVATVSHPEPHDGIARQVFLPSGPLAILPLTGNRSSLVWTETPDRTEALVRVPSEAFESLLLRRAGDSLGPMRLESRRWTHPLKLQVAERRTAERLALLGDAACSIHPLAGQGLNLGLKDAAALADVIGEAFRIGEDIGTVAVLDRYARLRRFDAAGAALSTDLLGRAYAERDPVFSLARSAGVAAVSRIGPLRRFLMRESGGATGAPPSKLTARG